MIGKRTEKKFISAGLIKFLQKYSAYMIFAIMLILCAITSENFFTVTNITNIFKQQAYVVIACMGMLFVILTGGIDLSIGSMVALGSVCMAAFMTKLRLGVFASVLMVTLVGAVGGFINGFLISYTKMAPFIMTMAMMTISRGAAYLISNGAPIYTPTDSIVGFSTLNIFGIRLLPALAALAFAFVLLFAFLLRYTVFGRMVIAIGSNETTVRLAGIRVKYYKTAVYAISGCCAAIAGVVLSTRTGVGAPNVGNGLELDCIAACVIGGASLSGGEGSVLKTVIGVLILALIGNMMNLLAIPAYPQDIIKGGVIVSSVVLQIFTSNSIKNVRFPKNLKAG